MIPEASKFAKTNFEAVHHCEEGWALLGLLLALGVMSIVLSSSIIPNVQMQVQREKETEMMYRGQQVSEGIARWYNNGALRPIQLMARPSYGYLTEMSKLRDGVTIGVREIKFVRPSAMIDPMTSSEWEPVRARDPRIMKFLQAWAAQTLIPIPTQYLLLAAPPTKSAFSEPTTPPSPNQRPVSPETGPGETPPVINPVNPGGAQQVRPPNGQRPNNPDEDDDDDDDDAINDPLAHLFQSSTTGPGQSTVPIVGVAPKRKGKATTPYFGLVNYEDWVFIYIPKIIQGMPNQQGTPNQSDGQRIRPPQVSQ
jgi:type II secretory pathway pseudopilin PulG